MPRTTYDDPSAEDQYQKAKRTIRGLTSLGNGGDWQTRNEGESSNMAVTNAMRDTQEMADSIRKKR